VTFTIAGGLPDVHQVEHPVQISNPPDSSADVGVTSEGFATTIPVGWRDLDTFGVSTASTCFVHQASARTGVQIAARDDSSI
jgi:hypothetical protein